MPTFEKTLRELHMRDACYLTVRQLVIFLTMRRLGDNCTVRGLAAELGLNKPAVVRCMDKFVEAGWAKRAADPADRRSVRLMLTTKGEKFVAGLA
jgi:DNA-binding MarR family transcriptional regulator